MSKTQQLREQMQEHLANLDADGVPKNLERIARIHWELNRPKMFAAMTKAGTLDQRIKEAVEATRQMMASMVKSGMRPWEAWEEAREAAILLPEEAEAEEPEDDVEREMREDFEMMQESRNLRAKLAARR